MLFHSPVYLFCFLPLVFFLYFAISRFAGFQPAKLFLLLASLFFYGFWNPVYLPLILASIVFNYFLGNAILANRQLAKKRILLPGIVVNLAPLFVYKYLDFSVLLGNQLLGTQFSVFNLVLPLAISFFTFQQIAYLVDCYRAEAEEKRFIDYGLFVCFFPQLISGPIVHHREMMPQFFSERNYRHNWSNIAAGLFLIAVGLAKKILLADNFSAWSDTGFANASSLTAATAWVATLCFTLQLYFDFSAYTDMALGSALLFNIRLPVNFNSPYKAQSIRDFWRRWHMTLSRWLRDYVYISLGGNRKGQARLVLALLVTFIVGGAWHGAGWTFIVWGLLHGLAVIVCYLFQQKGLRLPAVLSWFLTLLFVHLCWVVFRAENLDVALQLYQAMFGLAGNASMSINYLSLLYVLAGFLIVLLLPNSSQLAGFVDHYGKMRFKPNKVYALLTAILFFWSMSFFEKAEAFLYFQF